MRRVEWVDSYHDDEPRDQQADLFGPYWASIGPDVRRDPEGWSWTILHFDADNVEVASGFADDERSAKRAVKRAARRLRRRGSA